MEHDAPSSDEVPSLVHLLAKHEGLIRGFISRRSGPDLLKRMTLDDLYQETVRMALRGGMTIAFSGDAHFVSWVTTIAGRNIALSLRRPRHVPAIVRIKRPKSSGNGVFEAELVARTRTPSSAAANDEQQAALAEAIELLSEDHRTALRLFRMEERSLAEVAETLGRTKGATAQLIRRATRALRKRLVDNATQE